MGGKWKPSVSMYKESWSGAMEEASCVEKHAGGNREDASWRNCVGGITGKES